MLIFQLLFLMLCFMIIGEPLRLILSRYSNLFRGLNILQISVLNVYFGGFILYTVAIIPLHLFSATTAWVITITSGVISFFFHRRKFGVIKKLACGGLEKTRVKSYLLKHKRAILEVTIVFITFLAMFWIQLIPATKFIFGSIHDTSLHALFVELILENQQVPATHEPYLPAAIIYPQASHITFAYSSYILGFVPPKAVFYVSFLFNAMSVLAAYYLGKKMCPSRYFGVNLAFIVAFVSMWPMYITWGSNPFIVALPLFFICLSFLPFIFNLKTKNDKINKIIIGVFFGYLASIHPSFYQVLITSVITWLIFKLFYKPKRLYILLRNFLILFSFSILPIIPFLFKFIIYYPYPGHNIGIPSDLVTDITTPPTTNPTPWQPPIAQILADFSNWLFSNIKINPQPLLRFLWIGFFIASIITMIAVILGKRHKIYGIDQIALSSFGTCLLLILIAYFQPLYPSWIRFPLILYMSINLLIATFNARLFHISTNFIKKFFTRFLNKPRAITVTSLMAISLTPLLLYTPFIYYGVSQTPDRLINLYDLFAVTKESDYELMLWMRDNLNQEAVILTNPYEPGTFIPSVSQQKIVFPFSSYYYSASYRKLLNLLWQNVINETTYELMKKFEITHIYIGSKASHWWEKNYKWDPLLLLGSPDFKLVKNIGNSSLFEVLF